MLKLPDKAVSGVNARSMLFYIFFSRIVIQLHCCHHIRNHKGTTTTHPCIAMHEHSSLTPALLHPAHHLIEQLHWYLLLLVVVKVVEIVTYILR